MAIWQLRRRETCKASGLLTRMPDDPGGQTATPALRRRALHAHCSNKHSVIDLETTTGEALSGVAQQRLRLQRLDDEVARQPCADIERTWETTVRARAALACQKCTGTGEAPAEALQALSSEALWTLHEMLKLRFEAANDNPVSWTLIRLHLLPRVRRPAEWDEFCGIRLLKLLSKMYMAGVMWPLLFGFEPETRCDDMVMCVCVPMAVQAAQEWSPRRPAVVVNTGMKQAFDYVCGSVHS